jgi:Tfp pilus assembly protein PilN
VTRLEFNLLPEEFRRPEKEVRLKLWAVVLVGVAIVIIVFLVLVYTGQTRRLDELANGINETQTEIAKLQESVRLTEEVDKLKAGLEENINAINALANQNADRVSILQTVNRCIPPQLALVSLEERSQTYLITGYASSNMIVAKFIDTLRQSGKFTTVTLTFIRPTVVDREDVLSFEVSAIVSYSTPQPEQQL